jgi:hypothetical protein
MADIAAWLPSTRLGWLLVERFVRAASVERDVMRGACPHIIPSRAVLVGPTEALPNQDLPLPQCSRGDLASRSCAVPAWRLYRAAGPVSLSRGLVLRWSFFLLVR